MSVNASGMKDDEAARWDFDSKADAASNQVHVPKHILDRFIQQLAAANPAPDSNSCSCCGAPAQLDAHNSRQND